VQPLGSFPAFYGTRRFITDFTRAQHLYLSWARPIQSTTLNPISKRSILMLSIHLRLGLPSGLFRSGVHTNNLYTFLFSPIRATLFSKQSSWSVVCCMIFTPCKWPYPSIKTFFLVVDTFGLVSLFKATKIVVLNQCHSAWFYCIDSYLVPIRSSKSLLFSPECLFTSFCCDGRQHFRFIERKHGSEVINFETVLSVGHYAVNGSNMHPTA
jgi:hypothetical protein